MPRACHNGFMIISEVCLYIKSLSLEENFGAMVLWLYEKVVAIPEVCRYEIKNVVAISKVCPKLKSCSI